MVRDPRRPRGMPIWKAWPVDGMGMLREARIGGRMTTPPAQAVLHGRRGDERFGSTRSVHFVSLKKIDVFLEWMVGKIRNLDFRNLDLQLIFLCPLLCLRHALVAAVHRGERRQGEGDPIPWRVAPGGPPHLLRDASATGEGTRGAYRRR